MIAIAALTILALVEGLPIRVYVWRWSNKKIEP
jgi:hypothetical protein